MITIKMFGEPSVTINDSLNHVVRKKSTALLFILASQNCPVSRQKILGILWPDQDEHSARHSLSVALHEIKKLGITVVANTSTILLEQTEDLIVDTRNLLFELKKEHSIDSLQTAIDFYQGEFLNGFAINSSPEFSFWKAEETEQYAGIVREAIRSAIRICEENNKSYRALNFAKQLIGMGRFEEDAYRDCMRLYCVCGNRPKALLLYENLKQLLKEELDVLPMQETVDLYENIKSGASMDDQQNPKTENHYGGERSNQYASPPPPKKEKASSSVHCNSSHLPAESRSYLK